MSVPTVTSLSPIIGLPAGRQRVKVVGTNFRLPTVPPSGPAPGNWIRTVGVTFGGENADAVVPVSSTVLWVATPPWYGEPSALPAVVDVVVKNLDDNGAPIAGESVTKAAAYTYRREDLTAESAFTWVSRQLRRHLARNVIENVSLSADPDYSDNPATVFTQIAELPVLLLVGPTVSEDEVRRDQEPQEDAIETGVETRDAPPLFVVLKYKLILASSAKIEAINLCNLLLRTMHKRSLVQFYDGPGSTVRKELEVYLDGDMVPSDDADGRVYRYDGTLNVEGITTEDIYGVNQGRTSNEDVVTYESGDEDQVPQMSVEEI